jgi:hypothetical protein
MDTASLETPNIRMIKIEEHHTPFFFVKSPPYSTYILGG